MINTTKTIVLLGFSLLLLAGCASLSLTKKPLKIDGLIIFNNTSHPIKDATLYAPSAGKKVFCSYIAPQTEFKTFYPAKTYKGNSLKISWKQQGQNLSTDIIHLPPPKDVMIGETATGLVTINNNGHVTLNLKK